MQFLSCFEGTQSEELKYFFVHFVKKKINQSKNIQHKEKTINFYMKI